MTTEVEQAIALACEQGEVEEAMVLAYENGNFNLACDILDRYIWIKQHADEENSMYFEGVTHARCGGEIKLVPPYEGRREIGCSKCNFSYMCESLERPIEAVYRFIADGTFLEEEGDDDLF